MILLENQNIKTFFQKTMFPNWSEEGFIIKKVKSTGPRIHIISDLKGEVIVGTFYN